MHLTEWVLLDELQVSNVWRLSMVLCVAYLYLTSKGSRESQQSCEGIGSEQYIYIYIVVNN
jgi:hypothetical protein